MTAEIITIGNEILIGQVLDTNSGFIASQIDSIGINITQIKSISDNEQEIINALEISINHADFVIMTGGLGPTNDDITKNTLLKYFGGKLILHKDSLEIIIDIFAKRGIEVTARNRTQAEVPNTCQVILNKFGTAPGMIFKKRNTTIFSLPGVPYEMKNMLADGVLPYIKNNFVLPYILHKTILIEGIPESILADSLKDWEDALDKSMKVAYLPSPGIIRLRISISGENEVELKQILNREVQIVCEIIGPQYVFGYDSDTLQHIVGKMLVENEMTISVAESCSGGNISQMITSVPGCSRYFLGSVVAYSNEMKNKFLDIPVEIIDKYGAVSQEVAELMVNGIKNRTNSDCAVSTTGIAGPDGGTIQKPIGTVWISVLSNNQIISRKFLFGDNRERNIVKTSLSAFNMLRNLLIKHY